MKLKSRDLRDMTVGEVGLKIEALKEELSKLTYEARNARLEKPHRLSETRKSLARCYTILREKKLA